MPLGNIRAFAGAIAHQVSKNLRDALFDSGVLFLFVHQLCFPVVRSSSMIPGPYSLYTRTQNSIMDFFFDARNFLLAIGSLLISSAIVAKPHLPKGELLFIPLLGFGIYLGANLIMAFVAYGAVGS